MILRLIRARVAIALCSASLTASCTEHSTNGMAAARDSSGVWIVEFAAAQIDSFAPSAATLALSAASPEDTSYHFYRIRQVLELADGITLVADGSSQQLRLFDSAGAHLRTVGRAGDGPGEFRQITKVRRIHGDTLAVVDARLNRTTFVTVPGQVTLTLTHAAAVIRAAESGYVVPAEVIGFLSTNRMVVRQPVTVTAAGTVGWRQAHGRLQVLDRAGIPIRDLGLLPITDVYEPGGGQPAMSRPGVRYLSTAIRGYEVIVTDGSAYELRLLDGPTGELKRIYRETRTPDPATRLRLEPRTAGPITIPIPPATAAYDAVLVGADGSIWARDWTADSPARERWQGVDRSDGVLRAVVFPSGFRLHDVAPRRFLGVATDSLGIESVVAFSRTP